MVPKQVQVQGLAVLEALVCDPHASHFRERELFIDNLLFRIHIIIEMILVDRPCAMGV